jgi:hypothetical protein
MDRYTLGSYAATAALILESVLVHVIDDGSFRYLLLCTVRILLNSYCTHTVLIILYSSLSEWGVTPDYASKINKYGALFFLLAYLLWNWIMYAQIKSAQAEAERELTQ